MVADKGCVVPGAQTAAATATVGASMAKASEAMVAIGRTNDPQKMAVTMQQFAKENAKMDLGQEMMDDSLDSALDEDGAEEETDDLMNQVYNNFYFLNFAAPRMQNCIRIVRLPELLAVEVPAIFQTLLAPKAWLVAGTARPSWLLPTMCT